MKKIIEEYKQGIKKEYKKGGYEQAYLILHGMIKGIIKSKEKDNEKIKYIKELYNTIEKINEEK